MSVGDDKRSRTLTRRNFLVDEDIAEFLAFPTSRKVCIRSPGSGHRSTRGGAMASRSKYASWPGLADRAAESSRPGRVSSAVAARLTGGSTSPDRPRRTRRRSPRERPSRRAARAPRAAPRPRTRGSLAFERVMTIFPCSLLAVKPGEGEHLARATRVENQARELLVVDAREIHVARDLVGEDVAEEHGELELVETGEPVGGELPAVLGARRSSSRESAASRDGSSPGSIGRSPRDGRDFPSRPGDTATREAGEVRFSPGSGRNACPGCDGSSTYERPVIRQYETVSSRVRPRSGRTMIPLRTGIPASPRSPVPRTILMSTVSMWSVRVCPVAMRVRADLVRPSRARKRYRALRAASSSESPVRSTSAGTSSVPE